MAFDFNIPWYWKALGVVTGLLLLVAAIGGAFSFAHSKGEDLGRTTCQNAAATAAITALEDARKGYLDSMLKLQKDEDEISNTKPEDDDVMGRGLVDTINSL